MLHSIYCFPFFHSNRPFIVFSPLVLCFTPSAHRQLILFPLSSLFILHIHSLDTKCCTPHDSQCMSPNKSFFCFNNKTHRATLWPSDAHHQKTHLWRCRYTHLDLQTGLTQCFHSHPHGVCRSRDAISRVTVTQVLTVQVCFARQCISDISCSFSANDTHSIMLFSLAVFIGTCTVGLKSSEPL